MRWRDWMTAAQQDSLRKIITRMGRPKAVKKAFCIECVMVNVASMWIGIETDGYAHS